MPKNMLMLKLITSNQLGETSKSCHGFSKREKKNCEGENDRLIFSLEKQGKTDGVLQKWKIIAWYLEEKNDISLQK